MDQEGLWAIELLMLYEKKNIEEIKKRLFNSSDLLIYLHEVLAEKKIKLQDKDIYSEQLIIKLHLQNLSLIKLSDGHSVESRFFSKNFPEIKFLDLSSIITIVRSQYESLLMYQHLYINSKIDDEKKLRFESWIMSSMMLRAKVFANSKALDKKTLENENNTIEELKKSISNNEIFKTLSDKQQKSLLENGSGKLFKSWDTLFAESRFAPEGVFSKLYYIASVYAHSEGSLALQLKMTKHLKEHPFMKENLFLMLFYSYLMTNIMIKNIVNKFPDVAERYKDIDEKTKYEVDFSYELSFK